jgi:dihydrofolate synthase/folylpolyglutamate synthase
VRAILHAAGDPQAGARGALVAGTNGKGSTSAIVAAILQAAGHRVGTMPSPHLTSYTERIQVDGEPIDEAEFAAAVNHLQPRLESVSDEFGPPTEFEILTAVALAYLAPRCDRLVIEVGMGGRLDATNVLDLGAAVITNVDFDHMQYLGDTLEAIAGEKAGIIKAGNAVVTGATGVARRVVQDRVREVGAGLIDFTWRARSCGWDGSEIAVNVEPGFELTASVPLLGSFQAANAALAVATAKALGVTDPEAIARGLAAARSPGRLEAFLGEPIVLLDGGHNPAALAALRESLDELRERRRLVVVFGMMADKDLAGAERELRAMRPARVIFTAVQSPRAADPASLAASWDGPQRVIKPAGTALEAAIDDAGPDGLVLACGSLYLVGEVRPALVAARRSPRSSAGTPGRRPRAPR